MIAPKAQDTPQERVRVNRSRLTLQIFFVGINYLFPDTNGMSPVALIARRIRLLTACVAWFSGAALAWPAADRAHARLVKLGKLRGVMFDTEE